MPKMAMTSRTPRPSVRIQPPKFKIKEPTSPRFRNSARFQKQNDLVRQTAIIPNAPMSPQDVIQQYSCFLTSHELTEIFGFKEIYYLGRLSQKVIPHIGLSHNRGFDDNNGNLKVKIDDHLSYRYQIKQILGMSDHAITTLSYDHKMRRNFVVKIMSSTSSSFELPALKKLSYSKNIVHLYSSFIFRNHIIMCLEVLGGNVYSILSAKPDAASLNLARSVGKCLFAALNDCHSQKIYHGKINSRNILVDPALIHASFKLADFSSCNLFEKFKKSPKRLIERTPEEILVYKAYPDKIDIWNAALTLANIALGTPLIQGKNPKSIIFEIRRISGEPPPQVASSCEKPDLLVMTVEDTKKKQETIVIKEEEIPMNLEQKETEEEEDNYEEEVEEMIEEEEEEEEKQQGEILIPKKRDLMKLFNDQNFVDFLLKCFSWKPEERPTASQILAMPFFAGLPELINKKGK